MRYYPMPDSETPDLSTITDPVLLRMAEGYERTVAEGAKLRADGEALQAECAALRLMVDELEAPLMTDKAAAKALGISPKTLGRMAVDGQVEAVRVRGSVRYRRFDVERIVQDGSSS